MASYCPHCGAPAPNEARFCMKCGKERLPDPPVPDTPPAQPTPPAPAEAPAEPRPPASPPPPVYTPAPATAPATAPAPTAPSPVGAFFGRTFRGDWAGSAQAALWPFALLLIGGLSLAMPSYGQGDETVIGFTDRLRIALALLLQSVGGGFDLTGHEQRPSFGGSNGLDTGSDGLGSGGLGSGGLGSDGPGSDGLGSGGMGSDSSDAALEATASLHFVPLTVTALWIVALFIGVRVLRNRLVARGYGHQGGGTAGLEAAVRVSLLAAAGVLALSLFAQPEIEGVELSSSPVLAALGALGIALVVSYGVLYRVDPLQVTARPGVQAAFRAVGTALRALVVVLVLCSLVAFVSLARIDDLGELSDLDDDGISPLLVALLILPNLAVAALGISWGAGAEASVRGSSSLYDGGYESTSFGLSELGDVTNDWAIVGALALGLVCALTLGVLAARRCAGRGEQLLSAAVFFGLVLLLAAVGGLGVEASGAVTGGSGLGGVGGNGGVEVGLSVPEVLLFGLLWIFPAALLGPYLLRMAGRSGGPAAPAYSPAYSPAVPPVPKDPAGAPASEAAAFVTQSAPAGPATPPAPGTPVHTYGPHAIQLAPQPPATAKPRGRAGVWVATLAGAFLIGGGATAGILVWQDNDDGKSDNAGKDDKPSVSRSEEPSQGPSQEPGPSTSPTTPDQEPSDSADPADEAEAPKGSERVSDSEGFSFAVPEGWTRQSVDPERPGQITYAGSTGREEFLVGVVPDAPYTSYENLTDIEKHTKTASDKSDYRRIRLEENTFQGQDGAIWEYTYTDEADRTIHAINQSYVAENGTEYAIQLSWREDFWPAGEGAKTHRTALKTWRLTD
ncbi:zinc ribbon domain-containing protein [Streptomyces sp. G5(2025)]|uniref:zinc ribbon domain-containing protein n=1 Tax=Streptomyces sp. G5(2025) TaxID=3406628 RepID=UPI003C237F03